MVCLLIYYDGEANKNYLNGFIHDSVIYNGNRTEWSPIQSVIIRVIRVLKHARLWGADGNRKCVFTFNLPSHNHIHIA